MNLSVRNIPKFKDGANWSRHTFQPMRRRAFVYQNTNQNIAPVIKKFSQQRTEQDRIRHRFEALRHILKTFHQAYTIFFKWTAYQKPYRKCSLMKHSAHFVAYFFFLNNAMYRRDFIRFSRQVNKYLLLFRFTDFLRSSRYFSSIVILINFYHVECGDGRQPRLLVNNF